MKVCKDCKHYSGGKMYDFCNRKNVIDKSTINFQSSLCEIERGYGWLIALIFDECGRGGRFYEPKEARHETT